MATRRRHSSIRLFSILMILISLTGSARGAVGLEVPDPSIMLPLVPSAAQVSAPPCIKPGTRLTYFGMAATLTPKARGPGWVRFTNRFLFESLPGMPPNEVTQEGACGAATIGGLWISPEALAGLRPGQVIETNDKVGTSVTVSDVRPGSVTISEAGPLHRSDCTYDARTGMLSATTLTQQTGLARITNSLQLTGQQ